jgi:hypothetical protein
MRSRRSIAPGRGCAALLAAVAVGVVMLVPPSAEAAPRPYVPPHGKLYHGVSDTGKVKDFRQFRKRVREHPALLQEFFHWDVSYKASGATKRWERTHTLGVVSQSTGFPATGGSDIAPQRIAKGYADHYLLRINAILGNLRRPTYIRLFPEMNGHWNPYCVYNADGTRRGSKYTHSDFKRAWRRFVTIVRGGRRARVNARLRRKGMPLIHRARSNHDPIYGRRDVPRRLDRPKVAFMWVPQTFGGPNIPGNQPRDYWPGKRFVDWVGADIFSKFQSAFDELVAFQRRYRKYPFVVGEYSPWDGDPGGAFTRRLLDWGERHKRVRAMIYYRSTTAGSVYDINHYGAARKVLRNHLNRGRWDSYAPGTR